MRSISKILLPLAIMIGLAGCSEINPESPKDESKDSITISGNASSVFESEGGSVTVSFTASGSWTAKPANDRADGWISISPDSGGKGDASVTISAAANDTYDERNATIVIKAGTAEKKITVTQKQKNALIVSSSKIEVAKEGGEIQIEVKANIDFDFIISETSADWIHHSKAATKGLTTRNLTFTIDANNDTEKREGEIIVRSGEGEETIHVYQAAGDKAILLNKSEHVVGSEGGTVQVEIKSNCDYRTIMPDADWIKESVGTKAVSTHTLYFEISSNEGYDNRSADIIFMDTAEDVSDTLRIIQAQKDAIILSKKMFEIPKEGGEFDIELNTNIDYSFSRTSSWINVTEIPTKGLVSTKLHVEVEENKSLDNRSGQVIIKSTDQQITDTVYVEQAGGIYCEINQKEFHLTYEESEISIEIQSNCSLIIDRPQSNWIFITSGKQHLQSNGLYTSNMRFAIHTNKTTEERTAELYITTEDKIHVDTVFVTQMPQEAIITSKNDFNISDTGGNLEIDYKTEFDCDITVSDDWIKVITAPATRALSDHKLQIEVVPNTSSQDRTGEIVLSQKNGTLSDTLRIHQVAEGYLNISQKQYEFSEMSGEQDIVCSTNLDLKVNVPAGQDWLKATIKENNVIHVELEANQSEQDRETSITVQDYTGSYSETIQIRQKGVSYFLRCPENETSDKVTYAISYKGGILAHYIESDGPYEFEILTDDSDSWVRHLRQEKIGENQYHEVYELDENNTGKERRCTIRVSLGAIVLEFCMSQTEERFLIFSQEEFNVSSEGGSFPLEINANGKWASTISPFYLIGISNEDASWISLENNAQNGHGHDNATIIVQPNLTGQNRKGTIILEATFSGVQQQINIHQTSSGAIVISPKTNYILSSDTHTETITLATSDYSVEIDNNAGDWISLGQKNADGEGAKQEILIAENTTGKERKGTVTFISGSTKNQLTFTQLMEPPVLVDDTPEKWHSFPLPKITLTFTNPDSEGSQIYKAIVPDCEKLIAISSHKVLDCLYGDPSDSRIPRPKTLEYVLEDFDGVSYNAGTKIGLSNQYLASYYRQHGAEAMIKENIGILGHEITHSYQGQPKNCGGYTQGTHFFAFIEGVADAVRVLCGGFPNDSDRPRGGHYMNGYRETGFFLAWLVNNKDADFLRKFNESAHVLETWTFDAGIKYALGEKYSADSLWTEYQKAMGDI